MIDGLGFSDRAECSVIRADGSCDLPGLQLDLSQASGDGFRMGGVFRVECIKPDGEVRWVDDAKNLVLNAALDYALNTTMRNGTPVAAWFMGLVDNAGFTQFAAADTMDSHTGWAENLSFSGGARKSWAPGASSGQSITNASAISFVMTVAGVIRGLFIASDAASNAGTVKLWSEGAFLTGSQTVGIGDTLNATYTLAAATA